MRKILIAFLLLSFTAYSQVSVGSKHIGKSAKFKKGTLENFKNTTTIFVFSQKYKKEEYKRVLENTWTVTPFKIIDYKDFRVNEYLSADYSFATIEGFTNSISRGSGLSYSRMYLNFDIFMYDTDKVNKKETTDNDKLKKLLNKNKINIAQFALFPKIGGTRDKNGFNDTSSISETVFTEDFFHNYELGLIKNYLQKINSCLSNNEIYWKYQDSKTNELSNLKESTLYIPKNIKDTFLFASEKKRNNTESILNEILSNYKYKYEIIDNKTLNDNILNNKEIYYLRLCIVASVEKFIQVVNSKTGEIIYSNYVSNSFRLKEKDLSSLSNKVKKS